MTGKVPRSVPTPKPSPYAVVITGLGIAQIFAWGSSYYLLAVLAKPIARDTGWPFYWIIGGVSLGLLVAGFVSPRVGRSIARHGGRPVLALSATLLAAGLAVLGCAQSLPIYLRKRRPMAAVVAV
jgi:MFS family permease